MMNIRRAWTGMTAVALLWGLVAQPAQAQPLDPDNTVIEVNSTTPQIGGEDGGRDSIITVYPDHVEVDRQVDGNPTHDKRPLPPGLWSRLLDRVQKLDQHMGGLRAPVDASYVVLTVKQNGVVVKIYDSRKSSDLALFMGDEIRSPVWGLFAK